MLIGLFGVAAFLVGCGRSDGDGSRSGGARARKADAPLRVTTPQTPLGRRPDEIHPSDL